MTIEKVREVIELYQRRLDAAGAKPAKNGLLRTDHVRWMLDEMLVMLQAERVNVTKLHRWLGFVQGTLWCRNFYGIDEMRDHNRPVEESFVPMDKEPTAEEQIRFQIDKATREG